jgi:hypothetical protein
MEDSVVSTPPELIVKFWPPSVTARGLPAIKAIQWPLAFAIYSRPFVTIVMALLLGWKILLPGASILRRMAGL